LFFSHLNTRQAVARIDDEVEKIPEVLDLLTFIQQASRGIVK
jgi:acyl-[acyl carrier protein]--UDP-N-acetylglucosamine O-acyltransferase